MSKRQALYSVMKTDMKDVLRAEAFRQMCN